MDLHRRANRVVGGIVAGAGATALAGALVWGTPLGATESHPGAKVATAPAGALADGAQEVVLAGTAGAFTVQRSGDVLVVVATSATPGWTAEVTENDAPAVFVAFTQGDVVQLAAAALHDDGTLETSVVEKALPPPPPPPPPTPSPAPAKAEVKAADAQADDHDGWCDKDGDGEDDRLEATGFDGDHDRWDDHDGRDREHDGDGHDGKRDGRRRH